MLPGIYIYVLRPEHLVYVFVLPAGEGSGRDLSARQRHMLIGNSFSVHVVEQLLRPLRPLGECGSEAEAEAVLDGMGLRDGYSLSSSKWCSDCESAACCLTH